MANTIKQKRGTTDPVAGDLVVGELAINTTDGGVFTKTDGGSVVEVGAGGGGGGGGGVTYELIEDGASKAAGSYINISDYKAVYMICHNDPATNAANRRGPYLSTSNTSNTGVSTRNGRWWRWDTTNFIYETGANTPTTSSLYYGSNTSSDKDKIFKLHLQGLDTSNVFIETYAENNGLIPNYLQTNWSGVTTSGSSTWYLYIHQALLQYRIYGVK